MARINIGYKAPLQVLVAKLAEQLRRPIPITRDACLPAPAEHSPPALMFARPAQAILYQTRPAADVSIAAMVQHRVTAHAHAQTVPSSRVMARAAAQTASCANPMGLVLALEIIRSSRTTSAGARQITYPPRARAVCSVSAAVIPVNSTRQLA